MVGWPVWIFVALAPWTWFIWRTWHGVLELAAIGLPAICATLFLISLRFGIVGRDWRALLPTVSMLILFFVAVVQPSSAAPSGEIAGPTARILSANLESNWFSDNDFYWHLETNPSDIVVASEMQQPHRTMLRDRFAYYVDDVIPAPELRVEPEPGDNSYRRFGFPSIGVYSNYPLTMLEDTTGIEDGLPGFRVRVEMPDGPVILYALHVPKPSFRDGLYQVDFTTHRNMARLISEAASQEELPVVVAGDLNMTDRGVGYQSFLSAGLHDGMRATTAPPTSNKGFLWDLLRLRIDHILVDDSLCTESPSSDIVRFTDHRIIGVEFGPCLNGSSPAT